MIFLLKVHEKTAYCIHNIHTFSDDEKLRTLIVDFSLLIKQSPKHFTAKNFFVIDFTLMGKMTSAMMTYLVIFISFRPRNWVQGTFIKVSIILTHKFINNFGNEKKEILIEQILAEKLDHDDKIFTDGRNNLRIHRIIIATF